MSYTELKILKALKLLGLILFCVAVRFSCDLLFARTLDSRYTGTFDHDTHRHHILSSGTPLDTQQIVSPNRLIQSQ